LGVFNAKWCKRTLPARELAAIKDDRRKRTVFARSALAELARDIRPEEAERELTEMKTGILTMNGKTYTLNSLCNDKQMEEELIKNSVLPETERGSLFPCPEDRNSYFFCPLKWVF